MNFSSIDDALLYHAASINADSASPEPYEKPREATETFWRSAHPSNRRAQELFEQAGASRLSSGAWSRRRAPPRAYSRKRSGSVT